MGPVTVKQIAAPELPYRPRDPDDYRPAIGVIGCGKITDHHLQAYRAAGYDVVALCDLHGALAQQRREQYFPQAAVYEDHRDLLCRDDIQVVDITTHTAERPPLVSDAIRAGKHVLSQKPFVYDLDDGLRLADLADQHQVRLAVNQNARWAPHFSYLRAAVQAGLLGELSGVHLGVHWDHTWVRGTPFEAMQHLILFDYAIHWFDMVHCLLGPTLPRRVYASVARLRRQTIRPPLLAQVLLEYESAQASLIFDADTGFDSQDRTYVSGSGGTLTSVGPGSRSQVVTLTTEAGSCQPQLEGCWFPDGFHGTMGELLCSIAENRAPSIDGAAIWAACPCASPPWRAERHAAVVPGSVRQLPD